MINRTIILNDEILNSQRAFRVLLNSMCHPGTLYDLSFINHQNYLKLILKTLLDNEVSHCVIGDNKEIIEKEIYEMTGSKSRQIDEADFIVIFGNSSNGEIKKAKIGTPEYPDSSATLIYYISSNHNETTRVKLKGPGIEGEKMFLVFGINKNEFELLKLINSNYPLGLDSIFLYDFGKVFCIPRSTRIVEVL
ncbi:MAG: phosphonate C-P lyase system protein PhnH [Caldimicrobium sp.]|nr:phosphonate C-P lyase system protein PhnH [Caldimicrobium sp.]MCX7874243.1 phosphonate C-P lyase system protein PhnH [Caldimicrobium sp.]MDW8094772.1 phosphonate C-P lyase system protein PhnH [Caldimicrobium sp.]